MGYLVNVFLVITVICVKKLSAQEVGEPCQVARTGAPGTCKVIADCPAVVKDIVDYGLFPANCGFLGSDQVVCCLNPPRVITKPVPSNRISAKKCKEYEDAAYETISIYNGPNRPPITRKVLQCSTSNVPLVIGGEVAKPKEFPHMALIGYQADPKNDIIWGCGGSLISENFVLTASHCIVTPRITGPPKFILLGEYDLDKTDDDAQPLQVNVAESISHPQFKRTSKYYDIGLIRLDRRIEFNQYMRPACLPETYDTNTEKAIACGWGKTDYRGGSSKVLMKVVLELFTRIECNNTYSNEARSIQLNRGILHDMQFCAGSHTEKKDTCQGDSGGPIQIYHPYNTCMYTISGITSFGKQCGDFSAPGVYTRVYSFLNWIEGQVWPSAE